MVAVFVIVLKTYSTLIRDACMKFFLKFYLNTVMKLNIGVAVYWFV